MFRVANMGALTESQINGFLGAFEGSSRRSGGARVKAIILAAGSRQTPLAGDPA